MYFATQSFQSPRKQIFIWRIYNRLVDFSRHHRTGLSTYESSLS